MNGRGFLFQSGPNDLPRMTASQSLDVRRGALAAISHALTKHEAVAPEDRVAVSALRLARDVIEQALEAYPRDRSCFTCDFLTSGYCSQWKAEPPSEALPKGCEKWRDEEVPF